MGTFVFPQRRPGFTDRYPQKPGGSFLPSPQQIIGPAGMAMMPQGKPLNATTQPAQKPASLQSLVRPKTIPAAGSPMTQPLRQQDDPSALYRTLDNDWFPWSRPAQPPVQQPAPKPATPAPPVQQPPQGNPYDTPYYNARRYRNALGQGSPYIPGGQNMTAEQRQAGYAAMPQMAPGQQAYAPQAPASFLQRPAPGYQQPSQNPMAQGPGPLERIGAMNPDRQWSGTGRTGFASNKLPMATSREEINARQNRLGEGGPLSPAVAEAQFGGAVPQVDANGRSYFAQRQGPVDFAGSAQTAEEAEAKRLWGYRGLQGRNAGNLEQYTATGTLTPQFAFVGENRTGVPRPVGNEIAGRMAAGGMWANGPKLSEEQLAANRQGMLQRLADRRSRSMEKVTQLAQQRVQDRQGPTPLQRMMQQDPRFAAMMLQNQHQLALQGLENQGRLGVAGIEGQNAAQRNQFGLFNGLVANGMDPNMARRQAGLPDLPGDLPGQGPNEIPKFVAGNFNGIDQKGFDYLKRIAATSDDNYMLGVMGQMGIPANLHDALLNAVKPNFWRRMNRAATPNTPGGQGVAPRIPGFPS